MFIIYIVAETGWMRAFKAGGDFKGFNVNFRKGLLTSLAFAFSEFTCCRVWGQV